MTQNLRIGREISKIGLKWHFRSRNSTNNKFNPKNLQISYIIPHMIMFQKNLELNDSRRTNWMWKGENRPKMTFSFPKLNQQQMQA